MINWALMVEETILLNFDVMELIISGGMLGDFLRLYSSKFGFYTANYC